MVLGRLADVVRGQDWWFYKIPPLLACAYATTLQSPGSPARTFALTGGALLCICMVASFGYVINDWFDIAQDRQSGRRNRLASMPWGRRVLLCVVPIGVAFVTLRAMGVPPAAFWVLGANFLLPAAYSIPPIRLKERGVWGALADAGAAHLLPTVLIVLVLAPTGAPANTRWWVFVVATFLWTFLAGLRGIIVHQVQDRASDTVAGIETLGSRLGPARARALTYGLIFPAEVIATVVFTGIVVSYASALWVFIGLYGAAEVLKIRAGWILPMFEEPGISAERYVPLINNEWYEVWLPLGLAVQLSLVHPAFLVVPVGQMLAFWPNLRARGRALHALMTTMLQRER